MKTCFQHHPLLATSRPWRSINPPPLPLVGSRVLGHQGMPLEDDGVSVIIARWWWPSFSFGAWSTTCCPSTITHLCCLSLNFTRPHSICQSTRLDFFPAQSLGCLTVCLKCLPETPTCCSSQTWPAFQPRQHAPDSLSDPPPTGYVPCPTTCTCQRPTPDLLPARDLSSPADSTYSHLGRTVNWPVTPTNFLFLFFLRRISAFTPRTNKFATSATDYLYLNTRM